MITICSCSNFQALRERSNDSPGPSVVAEKGEKFEQERDNINKQNVYHPVDPDEIIEENMELE